MFRLIRMFCIYLFRGYLFLNLVNYNIVPFNTFVTIDDKMCSYLTDQTVRLEIVKRVPNKLINKREKNLFREYDL